MAEQDLGGHSPPIILAPGIDNSMSVPETTPNYALQDYQAQLRILEQKNRERKERFFNRDIKINHTISEDERSATARSKLTAADVGFKSTKQDETGDIEVLEESSSSSETSLGSEGMSEWNEDSPIFAPEIAFHETSGPSRDMELKLKAKLSGPSATQSSTVSFLPKPNNRELNDGATIPEGNLTQSLEQRVKMLEAENEKLRGIESSSIQTFHCLVHRIDTKEFETSYLLAPEWDMGGESVTLRGRSPVMNPTAYSERVHASFMVKKHYYRPEHQMAAVNEAYKENRPLPDPEPFSQGISLTSDEMINAMKLFINRQPGFRNEFPDVNERRELKAPYIWWYHCRKSHCIGTLPQRQAHLLSILINWIDMHYGALYNDIENQLQRGVISRSSLEFLVRPGQVLVSNVDGMAQGYVATARPSFIAVRLTEDGKYEWKWGLDTMAYGYGSKFFQQRKVAAIEYHTTFEAEEFSIRDLELVPLECVDKDIEEKLRRRGEEFWKCRDRRLVAKKERSTYGKHMGQRFMIDFNTYKELHPRNDYSGSSNKYEVEIPTNDGLPKRPDIYLFPPLVPGFDLRRKKWIDLEVDEIQDVVWNEQAFSHLVADEETKELILALVTNQIEGKTATNLFDNQSNGLVMLFHGPPGTGKTFAAESVAEITRKPLYSVTCGDIGTEPGDVEKYLSSVFHLGKIWDCVVLLDEADVFLEQRSLQDPKRSALVSVFRRVLEYYEGILILTTNHVVTFDEAFKSRIQLALRYEKLNNSQRKQIWRNFFYRLRGLGEHERINFDDIERHIEELAEYPMNGQQIRNSITTGQKLAKYMNKQMTFTHLKRAIAAAERFDKYSADVRGGEVGGSGGGVDGR